MILKDPPLLIDWLQYSSEFPEGEEFVCTELTIDQRRVIVVGESHERKKSQNLDDQRFLNLLEEKNDSIFILEGDPSQSNLHDMENSFSTKTKDFAYRNEIPLIILDQLDSYKRPYRVWQKAGTDLSEFACDFMYNIKPLCYYLLKGYSPEDILNEIIRSGQKKKQIQHYKEIFSIARSLISNNTNEAKLIEIAEKIQIMEGFKVLYDFFCRERYYQYKMLRIREESPNNNLFAVFGEGHRERVIESLKSPQYLTPLPEKSEIVNQINNILEIANLSYNKPNKF